jgi:choline dehydrogenase-like flavoprotein
MTGELYDVVIVGGGFAGAAIAKVIAESGGKRILILEAGRETGMSPDKYASQVTDFQSSLAKEPNTPYPNNPNAPQADGSDLRQILGQPAPGAAPTSTVDAKGYLVQTGPLPFGSDYTRALGGTSLHWLGTCLRMLPNDFKLRTMYGQGVDWPIGYEQLRSYYERAEIDIIGVAGSVTDQHYPGINNRKYFDAYHYPMHPIPDSYLDQVLASKLNGQTISVRGNDYTVRMSNTPAARNSVPRGSYVPVGAPDNPQQGQRCEGNSNCIPICPVQAKYSALKTLYELKRLHPGEGDQRQRLTGTQSAVTIQTQAVASAVELDEHGRVSGITYQVYDDENTIPTRAPRTVRGKVYVLAANAVQNATLLLASGAANSSGQVGRNLMDHPLILTWGLTPEPVWGFRGPLSTSGLEMFRDGPFRDRSAAFRIEVGNDGWNFSAHAPNSTVEAMVKRGKYGRDLRRAIGEVIPRQFRLALEMEQLPEASNYVTIDAAYRDQLDNYRPVIRYDLPDYVRSGFAMAKEASDAMFRLLGVPPLGGDENPDDFPYPRDYTTYRPTDAGYVTYGDSGYTFWGAGHLAGTHRMGNSRASSVVNFQQRSWDHDNLYLVGCGSMPTIGTSNPTLTMTALAIMAGESIVADLAWMS